jgi:hypothetical protein
VYAKDWPTYSAQGIKMGDNFGTAAFSEGGAISQVAEWPDLWRYVPSSTRTSPLRTAQTEPLKH